MTFTVRRADATARSISGNADGPIEEQVSRARLPDALGELESAEGLATRAKQSAVGTATPA